MEEKYQLTSKNNIGQCSSYFSQMRLVCESKNLAELHKEVLGKAVMKELFPRGPLREDQGRTPTGREM